MNRYVGVTVAVVAALLFFQVFFRYEYRQIGAHVWRIDRVTSSICELPCVAPSPTPKPVYEFSNP